MDLNNTVNNTFSENIFSKLAIKLFFQANSSLKNYGFNETHLKIT